MNDDEKLESLLRFCRNLRFGNRYVFSNKPIDEFESEKQHAEARSKPIGLWYSFGGIWPKFLYDNYKKWGMKWSLDRLRQVTHVYRLKLSNKVLKITNLQEFEEFEGRFATKYQEYIRWNRVAKHWSGIDIRFIASKDDAKTGSIWYWDWEMSSGCIWSPAGIAELKLVKSWKPEWTEVDR